MSIFDIKEYYTLQIGVNGENSQFLWWLLDLGIS